MRRRRYGLSGVRFSVLFGNRITVALFGVVRMLFCQASENGHAVPAQVFY